MGMRYHVVKKQVEYGETTSWSGYMNDLIDKLVREHCEDYYQSEDQTQLEVYKEDFTNLLEKLKNNEVSLDIYLHEHNFELEDIISFMERALEECDKDSDYIQFVCF